MPGLKKSGRSRGAAPPAGGVAEVVVVEEGFVIRTWVEPWG